MPIEYVVPESMRDALGYELLADHYIGRVVAERLLAEQPGDHSPPAIVVDVDVPPAARHLYDMLRRMAGQAAAASAAIAEVFGVDVERELHRAEVMRGALVPGEPSPARMRAWLATRHG